MFYITGINGRFKSVSYSCLKTFIDIIIRIKRSFKGIYTIITWTINTKCSCVDIPAPHSHNWEICGTACLQEVAEDSLSPSSCLRCGCWTCPLALFSCRTNMCNCSPSPILESLHPSVSVLLSHPLLLQLSVCLLFQPSLLHYKLEYVEPQYRLYNFHQDICNWLKYKSNSPKHINDVQN